MNQTKPLINPKPGRGFPGSPGVDWSGIGFEVHDDRFDQKNEMFKRPYWDDELRPMALRFATESPYRDKPGWSKAEFLIRAGAWHLEHGEAMGNSQSNHGLYSWDGISGKMSRFAETGESVAADPGEMSALVKQAAGVYGADLVGIAPVHPSWIYSHEFNLLNRRHYPLELPAGCTSAIVMAVAMDYDLIRSSNMVVQGMATGNGYSRMAFTASSMAAFVRGLGYRAIPCGNDTALSVPLALAAGLGEWSRMGLLVTRQYGPRVRLCKVFTDLPLSHDSYRPFGVVEFCKTCKTCAKMCPSQAIPHGEMTLTGHNASNHSGIKKWYVNCEKCFGYWSRRRTDCTTCVRVCPFNKRQGKIHDFTRWLIKAESGSINQVVLWGEKLMGYEHPYPLGRFIDK